MLTSLVLHEHIQTTEEKAKAIRAAADKLITKAKKGGDVAFKALAPDVNHNAVVKLVNDLAPRFTTRSGGYTRIIKTRRRIADNAAMVWMEWVEKPVVKEVKAEEKKEVKVSKAPKKETKTTEVVEAEIVEKPAKAKKEKTK